MRFLQFGLACCCAVVLGFSSSATAQPTTDLGQAFLEEAPAAWASLPKTLNCYILTASTNVTELESSGVKKQSSFAHTTRVSRNWGFSQSRPADDSDTPYSLIGRNDRYVFQLAKSKGSSHWKLNALDVLPRSDAKANLNGRPVSFDSGAAYSWLKFPNKLTLPMLVAEPSFRVIKSTPCDSSDNNCVQIDFECTYKKPILNRMTGWFRFDRNRYWSLIECDLKVTESGEDGDYGTVTRQVSYIDNKRNLPLMKRQVNVSKSINSQTGQSRNEMTVIIEQDVTEEWCADEGAFSLPAFGLPEPEGVPPPRSGAWVWLVGGGFLAVVAGVLVLRWRRRRAG